MLDVFYRQTKLIAAGGGEENYRHCLMFTVVAPTTSLSLDDHFIKRPAATFFVTAAGGGMDEHGILAGDTLIVDRSRTPSTGSIVIAAIEGELIARPFTAIEGEDAHVWGVVAGVVRSLP